MNRKAAHPITQGISAEIISDLVDKSRDEAHCHGLIFRDSENADRTTIIPHTLLPTPFSKTLIDTASKVQRLLNFMIHQMSKDDVFINKHLAQLAHNDSFMSSMLEIYNTSRACGHEQVADIAIIRADYMEHYEADSTQQLKQIEFNTVSPCYGSQCYSVAEINRATLDNLGAIISDSEKREFVLKCKDDILRGSPLCSFSEALLLGWKIYSDKYLSNQEYSNDGICILFVVSKGERNSFDQLKLVDKLRNTIDAEKLNPKPRIIMQQTEDLVGNLSYDKVSGVLSLKLNEMTCEVGLVYFRTFYNAGDFEKQEMKILRLNIELSRAIKIPNIGVQLVGSKKFQEILATDPEVVDHFTTDYRGTDIEKLKDLLRSTFATFHPLDSEERVDQAKNLVEADLNGYILKPQREGGSNNFYGDDIMKMLKTYKVEELQTFTLMSMVKPQHYSNYIVNNAKVVSDIPTISELGVWGVYLFSPSGEELLNKQEGFLLRTKNAFVLDGGVTLGRAVLSSILYTDK